MLGLEGCTGVIGKRGEGGQCKLIDQADNDKTGCHRKSALFVMFVPRQMTLERSEGSLPERTVARASGVGGSGMTLARGRGLRVGRRSVTSCAAGAVCNLDGKD